MILSILLKIPFLNNLYLIVYFRNLISNNKVSRLNLNLTTSMTIDDSSYFIVVLTGKRSQSYCLIYVSSSKMKKAMKIFLLTTNSTIYPYATNRLSWLSISDNWMPRERRFSRRISQSLARSGRVRKRRVEKSNRCRENNCRASITRYGNAIRILRCTEASDGRNYLMGYRYPVFNTYVLVTRAFPQLPVLAVHGNRLSYVCTVNYTRGKTEGGEKRYALGKNSLGRKAAKTKDDLLDSWYS